MKSYNLVLFLCFFWSCASVKAPDGGPKDSTPPKLVSSLPTNGALNFKEKSLQLFFNEDVSEDNNKIQFLSPKTSCTAIPGSKRLKITPDSGFIPNTTYVLNLKGKIKDDKEGNKLRDTTLVFSTGPTLDSLFIDAQIENLDRKPISNKVLFLLTNGKKTVFTAITDSAKNFKLSGLAPDKYEGQIFQDRNENYEYEEEDGPLWIDSLKLDSSLSISCRLLPQKYKPVKTFKQRKGDTCVVESSAWIKPEKAFQDLTISENKEKTLFWLYPFKKDLIYHYHDSLGNKYLDTLSIASLDTGRTLSPIQEEKKISIQKTGKQLEIKTIWNWKIFGYPGKLEYTQDSIWNDCPIEKLPFGYSFKLPVFKPGKLKWKIDSIILGNKAVYKFDSTQITKDDLESPGMIAGDVNYTGNEPIILELIDSKKEVLGFSNKKKFMFHVKPGKYKVQIFLDKDGNGMYTGGNKKAQRKAEPLFINPDLIELKPGWDLENIKIDPGF
jgi:hypothetical protein